MATWTPGDRFQSSGHHGTIISKPRKGNARLGDWLALFDGEVYTRHIQEWYMHPIPQGAANNFRHHLDGGLIEEPDGFNARRLERSE